MKYLIPTLREKKRYIVFKTIKEGTLSFSDLKKAIIESFKELFGVIGLSNAGIDFIEYKNSTGILRVNNRYVDHARASFCTLRKINKQDIILRTIGVSGILKKAKNKFTIGGE